MGIISARSYDTFFYPAGDINSMQTFSIEDKTHAESKCSQPKNITFMAKNI